MKTGIFLSIYDVDDDRQEWKEKKKKYINRNIKLNRTHFNDESPTCADVPFISSKSAVNVTTEPLIAGAFDFTRSK